MLQEMLEVLRDHQNNQHMSRLEWIVIILIAMAVRALAGWVGAWSAGLCLCVVCLCVCVGFGGRGMHAPMCRASQVSNPSQHVSGGAKVATRLTTAAHPPPALPLHRAGACTQVVIGCLQVVGLIGFIRPGMH